MHYAGAGSGRMFWMAWRTVSASKNSVPGGWALSARIRGFALPQFGVPATGFGSEVSGFRANMRFVPTKTPEQQSCLMLHRTCHLFIGQQTAVINSIRARLTRQPKIPFPARAFARDLLLG